MRLCLLEERQAAQQRRDETRAVYIEQERQRRLSPGWDPVMMFKLRA